MAATTTLAAILQQLVEETGTGFVIPSYTGTTTTLTLTNSYLAGPFSGAKFPIGSPIIVTSTTGLGEMTYVKGYVPSTGVITVEPAITTGSTDAVLFFADSGIDAPDRVTEAINRAVANRLSRPLKTPLTFVPDGDLQGTTVTDYWTAAANGTAAYVAAQIYPVGGAVDEFGPVGLNRVLQITSSAGGATSVAGNGIRTQLTAQNRTWFFRTAIRLVSGTGTAEFVVRDNTNADDITLQVSRGNDSLLLTTTTLGDFMLCEGTFQVPATCAEIAPKLSVDAASMVAQMTPLIMFPLDAVSFPIPNRIISDGYIGNFHYGTILGRGLESIVYSEPITVAGLTHHFDDNGDHRTVTFNFRPARPVYFDEFAGESSLSALTATTTFPLDFVVKGAKFELYKYLYNHEKPALMDNGQPRPSLWRRKAIEAKREFDGCDYQPETITVCGRV